MSKRMLPRISSQRLVFRASMVLVSFYILYVYVFYIIQSDLKGFIYNTAGPVFAALATLSGLSFAFSETLKKTEEKSTSALAGEKLLHSTLLFAFSVLTGSIAIQFSEVKFLELLEWPVKILCGFLGVYLLFVSFQSALYGVEWLSDILYMRWSNRAEIEGMEPKKLIKDHLEYEIEGLPEQEILEDEDRSSQKTKLVVERNSQ
jgi:hypothetical protein